MGFGIIIGVLLLLVGISILLKVIFGIDLPLTRVAIALFLIYLGVRVLVGGNWFGACNFQDSWRGVHSNNSVTFGEATFQPGASGDFLSGRKFQVVFGKGTLDLSTAKGAASELPVEVHTVFGEMVVLVDAAQNIVISANSAFGDIEMPNHDHVAFGSMTYRSADQAGSSAKLHIQANVVFGSIRFVFKKPVTAQTKDNS